MIRDTSKRIPVLALAALGVVFGDIGTSPLYTLTSCFQFSGANIHDEADIMGIASLLFWALLLVVCVKYCGVIMRVDQDGEGGILALLALGSPPARPGRPVANGLLTIVVVIGAAMLMGDGSITPAISVISAIEGIKPLAPMAGTLVVPISVAILLALFTVQRLGTEYIGRVFGPIMVVWFSCLAVLGVQAIAREPIILRAFDPRYGALFLAHHGGPGFFVFGGVVLAITGVEALYADLSHFGRIPIVVAWYVFVLPALVLAYFGESANLLIHPEAIAAPFYALVPPGFLVAAIILTTMATVIASQALISGVFTLVEQAISLGLSPRLRVQHTSDDLKGQVYLPTINVILAVGCIVLVCGFRSSDALASAFGLAVSCTMLATSFAWYAVVTRRFKYSKVIAMPLLVLFTIIDGAFVVAGLPKFLDGGYVPFIVSALICIVSFTWLSGRRRFVEALAAAQTPIELVHELIGDAPVTNLQRLVILTPDAQGVPFAQLHPLLREQMKNFAFILLKVEIMHVPRLKRDQRIRINNAGPRITVVEAFFGYMEQPRLSTILEACKMHGLDLDDENVVYAAAVARTNMTGAMHPVARFQRSLFTALQRGARQLSDDLEIPTAQRIGIYFPVSL